MSYVDPKEPKWLTRGSALGGIGAIAVVVLGWPMLFATVWNCAHRTAEVEPCSPWSARLVFLGILVVAALAFWFIRRLFDRRPI